MLNDVTTIKNLQQFAKDFSKVLKKGEIIGLRGDLGSGKTTFVKVLLKTIGIKDTVISPTYLYEQEYLLANAKNGIKLIRHLDLYRIDNDEDIDALGLDLGVGDLFLIEWIENAPKIMKQASIILDFFIKNQKRFIRVKTCIKK